MKSRLIKFACHQCGTKLAVPPEMAGVSDLCPKCGTMITAPQESTLEPVRKKSKFAPIPKEGEPYAPASQAQPQHAHQHPAQPQPHQPEAPAVPGWSASELADALRPPAPAAPISYVPQPPSPAVTGLLPDPPAIPDPGPVFSPKRKARTEGEIAGTVAVAPPPPVAKSEHPILGSILDAPTIPRGRATPQPADPAPIPLAPPLPPGPLELPPQLEMAPAPASVPESVAPAPTPPVPPVAPSPELAWGELDPEPGTPATPTPTPMTAEAPPLPSAAAPTPAEQGAPAAESAGQQPSLPTESPGTAEAKAPASTEPSEPQAQSPFSAAPVVQSSPIALVPESLPDARAAEEAAMPGMGEVLAGGQVAQDPPAPPDTRDHRPLLNVPFLPVAESPKKERRQLKRKLYIVGVILFFALDAAGLMWFFRAKPEAANDGAGHHPPGTAPTAESPAATGQASRPAGSPSISSPTDFAATTTQPSGTDEPKKSSAPPMAIPLPGHSSTDVPTATPVQGSAAETAPPAPAPAPATVAMAAPGPGKKNKKPEAPAATTPKGSTTSAPPSPASSTAAPGAAPTPSTTAEMNPSMAALMGPQPQPATAPTGVDGDPPWLKRIKPTFPAIDGTPLLPSTSPQQAQAQPQQQAQAQPQPQPQPMSPPPPLPPPPAPPAGDKTAAATATTAPPPAPSDAAPAMTAATSTPSPNPETAPATPPTDAAATAATSTAPGTTPPTTTTPPDAAAPVPMNTSTLLGKVPDEAQGALTTLRKFLAAPTWEARAAYVQKPEETKPAMEKHARRYGDGPVNPGTIKFVDRHPGKDGGPPYCMFEITGGDLKHNVLVLVEQPKEGEALVDWATFVEFKDDLLLKFLETQGEPNQSFRVMLSRKHYFAKDVPDLASKDSFQVQQPNDSFDGHVFLPKNTALSKKLASQLGWNQNMPVIVELAWRTNGKLHWVEIVRIVNYGWRG